MAGTAVRARPDPGRRCDDRAGSRRRRDRRRSSMGSGRSGARSPAATTARTAWAVAGSTRRRPTMAAGAWLQAPMQGARQRPGPPSGPWWRAARPGGRRAPDMRAAQAVADADGDRRRRRLALLHHVEVVVEGGDLVDLGLGEAQLLGQGRDVLGGDVAPAVLDQVQELDQQVAPARPVAQQRPDRVERLGLRPAGRAPVVRPRRSPLPGCRGRPAARGSWMIADIAALAPGSRAWGLRAGGLPRQIGFPDGPIAACDQIAAAWAAAQSAVTKGGVGSRSATTRPTVCTSSGASSRTAHEIVADAQPLAQPVGRDRDEAGLADMVDQGGDRIGLDHRRRAGAGGGEGGVDDPPVLHLGHQEAQRQLGRRRPADGRARRRGPARGAARST